MPFQSSVAELSAPAASASEREAEAFQLAINVLAELRRRGIHPSPANYTLWHTFRSGADAALGARMGGLVEQGVDWSPALLEQLQDEYLAGVDVETVADTAGALEAAADTVIGQVAAGQESLRDYGAALEACSADLGKRETISGLVQAIAILTAETSKAADRNRVLEQQLTLAAARVAKLRQSLVEVRQEATTDALTGMTNRKAFEAKLKRAMAGAKTDPVAGTVSALLLDIDHFKQFNDVYGHRTGDLVLRLVGRVLTDNVKGRDTAARYGGEEFAILLAGADLRAATIVAEQICAALSSKRLTHRGKNDSLGQISMSVGVAQHRRGDSGATLMERADMALYHAKQTGRSRVCTEREVAAAGR